MPLRANEIVSAYLLGSEGGFFAEVLPIYKPTSVGSAEYFRRQRVPAGEHETFRQLVQLAVPVAEMHRALETRRGGFYPDNWTKERIEEAARRNPSIFDPYTIVEDVGGRLVSARFHKHPLFYRQIGECSDILERAALLSRHPGLVEYLKKAALFLKMGRFDDLTRAFVEMDPKIPIRVQIGFFESYEDKQFARKRAPHLVLGVPDARLAARYWHALEFVRRTIPYSPEDIKEVRLDPLRVYCVAGGMARWLFNCEVLPNSPEEVKEYGARILAFHDMHGDYLKGEIFPTISRHVQQGAFNYPFNPALYTDVRSLLLIGEEFGHLTFRLPDARDRLAGMYDTINEVVARVLILAGLAERHLNDNIKGSAFEAAVVGQFAATWSDLDSHTLDPVKNKDALLKLSAHVLRDLVIYSRAVRDGGIILDEKGQVIQIVLERVARSFIDTREQYLRVYQNDQEERAKEQVLRDICDNNFDRDTIHNTPVHPSNADEPDSIPELRNTYSGEQSIETAVVVV